MTVSTPTFIEFGDDDLPVVPVPTPTAPVTAARGRARHGRRRTNTSATAAATRQYRQDKAAIIRGEAIRVPKPSEAPDSIPEDVITDSDDLAAVVVKKTLKQLAAGKVTPTLRDGLSAQQLLDRRAEKAADRSFMLNLAMALAGGGVRTPIKYLPAPNEPDPDVIEGDFTEENLAPDHLRQG